MAKFSAITPEKFSAFAASRRVTRSFSNKQIPEAVLQQVLADGMSAPSWSNTRPFVVAVAQGKVRDELSEEFLRRWDVVSRARAQGKWGLFKLWLKRYGIPTSNKVVGKTYTPDLLPRAHRVGRELYGYIGVERGDAKARDEAWAENYRFFGAPVELFLFNHKSLGKFSATDAALWSQNVMLSAHAHGLGTCPQGAVSGWEDAVREKFDVPDEYELLWGLAIGYPAEAKINNFGAHRMPVEELLIQPKN